MSVTQPDMTRPSVSALIITYNQEKSIAQAIESALMQQVNFHYEILIGEDCSTDGTRSTVQDYAAKHPGRIRALLHPQNLGPAHSPGKNNFVSTLKACRGEYVALLEGDDYWIFPHKLQKQVDFLESHPECAICFHNVMVFWEDGRQPPREMCPADQKEISTLEDLLRANFIPTCSVMFRNGLVREFPGWYYKLRMGDWTPYILLAQYGKIGHINEVMAAYRVHRGGVWNAANNAERLGATLQAYGCFNMHFAFKYERPIMGGVSKCLDEWAESFVDQGVAAVSVDQVAQSVTAIFENPPPGLRRMNAHKSKTLGRFYAVTAMMSYQAGNLPRVRYSLSRALRYDVSWLRNRGIWSIGIEALFGRGLAVRLRHGAAMLTGLRKSNVAPSE